MKKRILSLVLALCMVIGLMPMTYAAELPELTVEASAEYVYAGDDFTVSIVIPQLSQKSDSGGFALRFDKDNFTLTGVEMPDLPSKAHSALATSNSIGIVTCSYYDSANSVDFSNGASIVFSFTANADADLGSYDFDIIYDERIEIEGSKKLFKTYITYYDEDNYASVNLIADDVESLDTVTIEKALELIDSVDVSVDAPVHLDPFDSGVEFSDIRYGIDFVRWEDEDGEQVDTVFEVDQTYTVYITLFPMSGYRFDASTVGKISGENAEVKLNENGTITVSRSYFVEDHICNFNVAFANGQNEYIGILPGPGQTEKGPVNIAELYSNARIASIYDEEWQDITVDTKWEILDVCEGISAELDEEYDFLRIYADEDAKECQLRIRGSYTYRGKEYSETVVLYVKIIPQFYEGVISGADSINVPTEDEGSKTESYTVSIWDQYGDPYGDATILGWSVVDGGYNSEIEGVSIDENTGVVTVLPTAQSGKVRIVVKCMCPNYYGYTYGETIYKVVTICRAEPEYDVSVSGETQLFIPASGETEGVYTAECEDQYGLEGETTLSTDPEALPAGIGFDPESGTLSVSAEAMAALPQGGYTVVVVASAPDGNSASIAVNIDREPAVATSLKIFKNGVEIETDALSIPETGANSTEYSAKVYDQYGIEMEAPVSWEIEGGDQTPAGVSVDDGVVEVLSSADEGSVELIAYVANTKAIDSLSISLSDLPAHVLSGAEDVELVYGAEPFTQKVSCQTGTVGYSSSDESVAAVDPVTGEVTVVGVGEAVITAAVSGDAAHASASVSYTVTVTPAPLTITGLDAVDRVYNGDVVVALTGGSLQGLVAGDQVSFEAESGTAADKNVGEDKPVRVPEISLGGADADNYYLAGVNDVFVTITPAELSISDLAASDRLYDGSTAVALSGGTPEGIIGDDDVTVQIPASGTVADKNAGNNKPVSVPAITLSGADAGNYVLADVNDVSVSIWAVEVIVAGLEGADRVYDGSTAATVTGGTLELFGPFVVAEDALAADDVAIVIKNAKVIDKNVGEDKPVTFDVSLVGADAGNYIISAVTNVLIDITPATLSISGLDAADRVYDGTVNVAVSGGVLEGLVDGDEVSFELASAAMADKHVGENKPVSISEIALVGADAGNYVLAGVNDVDVTITPAQLSVSGLEATARLYDGSVDVAITGGLLEGVIAGDDVSAAMPTAGTVEDAGVGVDKAVSFAEITLSGADAGNYVLSSVNDVTVGIYAMELSLVDLQATDRVYDGTTDVVVSGGKLSTPAEGDDVDFLLSNVAVSDKNVGENKTVSYTVELIGEDADNYLLTQLCTLTVTITPAQLSISGLDAVDRVYDGTVDVAVSGGVLEGIIEGDDVSVTMPAVGTMSDKNAGEFKPVTVIIPELQGEDAGNYVLAGVNEIDVTISKAQLSISGLEAADRSYDATADVAVSGGLLEGVIEGDDVFVTMPTEGGMTDKHVGEDKPVYVTKPELQGEDAGNYKIVGINDITVTISKAVVNLVNVSAVDRVYEQGNTAVEVNYESMQGRFAGDELTVALSGSIETDTAGSGKAVTVTMQVGGADAGNYEVVPVSGITVNILKDVWHAKSAATSAKYGSSGNSYDIGKLIAPNGSVGTVTVDTEGVLSNIIITDGLVSFDVVDDEALVGSKVVVSIPVTGADNYEDYVISLSVTVTDKPAQDISFSEAAVTKTYGDDVFTLAAQGEAEGSISYSSSDESVAVVDPVSGEITIIGAGETVITATADGTNDYAETSAVYTLTVKPAVITVTANSYSIKVDEEVPVLGEDSYVVSGLVYDDTLEEIGLEISIAYSSEPDNSQPGNYEIIVSGAEATDNYIVKYVKGELTISPFAVGVIPEPEDPDIPDFGHACPVCGGCIHEECQEHGSKCLLLTMNFSDVEDGKWYTEGVEYVYHRQIMIGTAPGLFDINGLTNRAQVVTILWRLAGSPKAEGENPFTDVPNNTWFSQAVIWAASEGIVNGYGDGRFGPMDSITREQMAKILCEYAQYEGFDVSARADLSGFEDADAIGAWAVDYMSWANAEGLIQGMGNGCIEPRGNALRCQVATLIMRFCESILYAAK